MISFDEINHIYRHDSQIITSVTQRLKTFAKSFESHYWAAYGVVKNTMGEAEFQAAKPTKIPDIKWLEEQMLNFPDVDFSKLIEAQENSWEVGGSKASIKGTAGHKEEEKLALEAKQNRSPFNMKIYEVRTSAYVREDGLKISNIEDLALLEDGMYPEQLCWYLPFYMGTSDRVYIETINSKRYVDLVEFKFVKTIDKTSQEKMHYPIQHVANCRYNRFALQLTMYAKCFEIAGFNVRKLAILHNTKYLPVPYMELEMTRIEQYLRDSQEGFL